MLQEQLESMIANFDKSLHEKGMELGLYLAHLKKTQEDLKKEWHSEAENQVRRGLIMREIAKREGIKVGEDEDEGEGEGDLLLHEKIFEFLEKENIKGVN